ncbi:MAG TPA: ricin-type beta-trefoil lectin domain protein [Actinocrinis sp.]|nr:ricin-type beta-trefoil lectin domain protein [Actinocrinis sp.]
MHTSPADQADKLTQQASLTFGSGGSGSVVTVNPNSTYQTITGFGGSMTDASAYDIWNSPSRTSIMNNLFSSSGIDLSFLRQPIGAADFSTSFYSLDVRSASNADGTPVQVYTCNGTGAQQWTVASNGTVQALGKCLDVVGAGTANGTLVDLYTCNGTGAQSWVAESNGELENPNSGKCLDDTGYGASGTQVQIWSCTDTSNQQWKLP